MNSEKKTQQTLMGATFFVVKCVLKPWAFCFCCCKQSGLMSRKLFFQHSLSIHTFSIYGNIKQIDAR